MNEPCDAMFYIKGTADKLKPFLNPLILESNPGVGQTEIDFAWDWTFRSVDSWMQLLEKHVIPNKNRIFVNYPPESKLIAVPPIFPGLSIREIPVEVYEKLRKAMQFYLNLYDILKKRE